MNILLMNGLPEEYEGIPISADFRNMIQVDLILHDQEASEVEKTVAALEQLYPVIPQDVYAGIAGLEWFFTRGQDKKDDDGKPKKAEKKAFDFEQDANVIFAGFYATYGISLTTIDFLHWWEFMALFEGLPEDSLMKRIIYWRTVDLNSLPKHERKYVQKMRRTFALKQPDAEPMSMEEMNQQTKDRVAQRFEAAQRALAEREKKE